MQQTNKHYVYGEITIPIVLPVICEDHNSAINYALSLMNNHNISLIEIDIHTTEDKSHIINANEYNLNWFDIKSE